MMTVRILITAIAALISVEAVAQKKSKQDTLQVVAAPPPKKYTCDSIFVDVEKGMVNGKLAPTAPLDSIKKFLPCITTEFPPGTEERICGSGALLEKHGIYFNVEHSVIEFFPSTTALLPFQVFGVLEEELAAIVGEPTQITDLQPYTDRAVQSVYLFPKSYGCLAIWVDQKDKKAFKVQLHTKPPASAYLCIE